MDVLNYINETGSVHERLKKQPRKDQVIEIEGGGRSIKS